MYKKLKYTIKIQRQLPILLWHRLATIPFPVLGKHCLYTYGNSCEYPRVTNQKASLKIAHLSWTSSLVQYQGNYWPEACASASKAISMPKRLCKNLKLLLTWSDTGDGQKLDNILHFDKLSPGDKRNGTSFDPLTVRRDKIKYSQTSGCNHLFSATSFPKYQTFLGQITIFRP